jgi:PAS domain S-box-containing protein
LLSENIQQAVHQADRTDVSERVQQAIQNDMAFDILYNIFRPDGSVRWAQSIGTSVTNGNRTVVEVGGTLRDITDRKLGQEPLEESERRYRAIVEGQTELICRFRSDKRTWS